MESTGVSAQQPVRVALIGCGAWGRNLVRTHAALGSLVAVVDPDPAVAAAQAETYGVEARTFEEVLADPSVDAVVVAAPAADHAALAEAALAAGKHCYVEKPLALTVEDAERVVAAAEGAGRVLMVGHLLQYHPAFLRLRELVDAGALGELRYLYSNRLNLGRIRQEENSLWSFAPHDLSMLLSLVGEEPSEVTATGATFLNRGVADVTTTHLAFPSGPRAHVFVSWLHPFKEQRLVAIGTQGMLVFEDSAPQWEDKLKIYRHVIDTSGVAPVPKAAEAERITVEKSEPLRNECQHFLDCVANGATPRTDGVEGLAVLNVLRRAAACLSA